MLSRSFDKNSENASSALQKWRELLFALQFLAEVNEKAPQI
jgi:hypothetical protein